MMDLLVIALIVYIVWLLLPRITMWLTRWFLRRQAKRMFGTQWPGAQAAGNAERQPQPEQPSEKKVFTRQDGEYVDFEEVSISEQEQAERRRQSESVSYRREEQVTDAEWTEL